MKLAALITFFAGCFALNSFAQTCTFTLTGNQTWNPSNNYACQEGGTSNGKQVLIIPAGLNMTISANNSTWTGTQLIVYGTLKISAPGNVTINANIRVKSGGKLQIDSKLHMGASGSGCNYNLVVESGGVADVGGTSDRLNICGNEISRGGSGGCNSNYPNGNPSYCAPSGGFTGPTGFDKGGYNGTLPVTWLSFTAQNRDNEAVHLEWATASEKDADSFVIERSSNGKDFQLVGSVTASGTSNVRHDYNFTDPHPLIGRSYYRLRQVDFDGTFSYSEIRAVKVDGRKTISVYPNPIDSDEFKVLRNFVDDEEVFVSIYDATGLIIDQFSFFGTMFSQPSKLNAGAYILRAKAGDESLYCRFVVK